MYTTRENGMGLPVFTIYITPDDLETLFQSGKIAVGHTADKEKRIFRLVKSQVLLCKDFTAENKEFVETTENKVVFANFESPTGFVSKEAHYEWILGLGDVPIHDRGNITGFVRFVPEAD